MYQATFRAAGNVRAQDRSYSAEGCVVDPSNASACRSRTVTARTPCDTTPPTITITAPKDGDCVGSSAVPVSADATNTNSVKFQATRVTLCGKGPRQSDASATVTGSSPFSTTLNLTGGSDCYELAATATNSCTGATASAVVNFQFRTYPSFCPLPFQSTVRDLAWSSDLGVEGARLQVVVNGGGSAFPARGRSYGTAASIEGDNRVEAMLVEASGKPGLWRFDLMTTSGVAGGTIRVIAGEPVQVSSTSVTFRLQGHVGERVVFTFQKK